MSLSMLPPDTDIAPQARQRTYRTTFAGQPAWVKLAQDKSFPLAPLFQRAVRTPLMPPVLRCSHIFNRKRALAFEAGRLRHLAGRGHNVPHIFDQTSDHLVLSDVGTSIWLALHGSGRAQRGDLIRKVGEAMAGLHDDGQFHGQPYPKNLTVDAKGAIHFIDLEDDVEKVMGAADAQLRDIWLLAHGHWPFAQDMPHIGQRVVNAYVMASPPDRIRGLAARLPQVTGLYARLVHAGAGPKVADNIRRYQWTAQALADGFSRQFRVW